MRAGSAFLLGGCAVATYRIGGLALLVPVLYVGLAAGIESLEREADARAERRKAAWLTVLVLALVVPPSLLDPGGAGLVVVPTSLPLAFWAARTLRATRG